jgi:preprotein translocase subunit SecG
VLIVGSIMLQQGKGSDLGSAFGGGSSDSLFGPLGPSNFFSKLTWGLITVFFVLCLLLAYISKQELTLNVSDDVIEEVFDEPPVE